MNTLINSLTVLRSLENSALIRSILEYARQNTAFSYNDMLREIYAADAEEGVLCAVQNVILRDVNAYSKACAKGETPSAFLEKAYLADLSTVFTAVKGLSAHDDFAVGRPLRIFDCDSEVMLCARLENFYRENGYGVFIDGKAFGYCDGGFIPLGSTDCVTLSQLKNYESEKALIDTNIKNFIENLPFSHMLLYGDRGTGKSSTVHAMLNAYGDKGLRLIELDAKDLPQIKKIKGQLAQLPLKFILFIDDLTLDGQDERTSALKTAVEGTVVCGNNVMIVATSNRRHVIKENFTDRDNSVHPSDSIEEQLSLSDRFGLTVMFSSTDKTSYLSIVRQLAADADLGTAAEELETLAERWAILNGGRSPRRARQFIDFVYACEKSGRKIDF